MRATSTPSTSLKTPMETGIRGLKYDSSELDRNLAVLASNNWKDLRRQPISGDRVRNESSIMAGNRLPYSLDLTTILLSGKCPARSGGASAILQKL